MNPRTALDVNLGSNGQRMLAGSLDPEVRRMLALNPMLVPEVQRTLALDPSVRVREALASSTGLPADIQRQMIAAPLGAEVLALASNSALDPALQLELAGRDEQVRFLLAGNPALTERAQLVLAGDENAAVRIRLADNSLVSFSAELPVNVLRGGEWGQVFINKTLTGLNWINRRTLESTWEGSLASLRRRLESMQ